MKYTFLQNFPEVELTLIEHYPHFESDLRGGKWSTACYHNTWVLDYARCDRYYTRVERGKPFPWKPDTWNVYAPRVKYFNRYENLTPPKHEVMWILFKSRGAVGPLSGRPLTVVSDPEGRIAERVGFMYQVQEKGEPGSSLILQGSLLGILGEIFTAAFQGHAGTPKDPWTITNVKRKSDLQNKNLLGKLDKIVIEQLSRPPSLQELSEKLGLSTSSLQHRFKLETGWTVIERIRWLRIREARRLLANPEVTIKEVSYQLGFKTPFYFSRVFQEVTGISPRDFLHHQK